MDSRRSMLTVVKNGLHASGRTTYLHRMLYIGEHKLGRNGLDEFMKNAVTAQAELVREEGLVGFLLVYHNHFIHLVEGSESTLTKHLRAVVNPDAEDAPQIGRVKVIFEITHINKVKQGTLVAETARHANVVLSKTLRLIEAVKKLPPGAALSQQVTLQLPEPELLQALLDTPLLKDVRDLLEEQRVPPRITLYDDVVWPMQSDFVPYNLLEEPIEMPRTGAGRRGAGGRKGGEEDEGAGVKEQETKPEQRMKEEEEEEG